MIVPNADAQAIIDALMVIAVRRSWDVPELGLVGIAFGLPIMLLWLILARYSASADLRRVRRVDRTLAN